VWGCILPGYKIKEKVMRIFTHSGQFHADDALSVAMAQLAGFSGPVIRVRTLPSDFIPSEDLAIDVGGQYDPEKGHFDHHQRDGSADGRATAGKFWAAYGSKICGGDSVVSDRVYQEFVAPIDRADIGVRDWQQVREDWKHLSASALIASMNPPFGSEPALVDLAFDVAVLAMSQALAGAIHQAQAWVEMAGILDRGISPEPGILVIEKGGPWQEHIFSEKFDNVLYVLFPSDRGGFLVQCVPDKPGSFGQRKPLPSTWRGARENEFASILKQEMKAEAEVSSSLFCHPGGFICGAATLGDAVTMAKAAAMES
jgi:uncharacterized UPF0160 family protein